MGKNTIRAISLPYAILLPITVFFPVQRRNPAAKSAEKKLAQSGIRKSLIPGSTIEYDIIAALTSCDSYNFLIELGNFNLFVAIKDF